MEYKLEKQDQTIIIHIKREITIFTQEVQQNLLKELKELSVKYFIFNMKDATWIDSMGIGNIISVGKIAQNFNKKVVVINCNEKISMAIKHVHLDQWIDILDNIEQAIEYFKD